MNSIRHYRSKLGLTQTELALKIGVSLDTVSRWETGKRDHRSSELRKMATLFGCAIDDLLDSANPIRPRSKPGKAKVPA
jgi:transcriptional regulator with XRE-family HTH domain